MTSFKKRSGTITKQPRSRKNINVMTIVVIALVCMTVVGVSFAAYSLWLKPEENHFRVGTTGVVIDEPKPVTWQSKKVRLIAEDKADSVPGVARVMFVPRVLDQSGNYIQADIGKLDTPVGNKIVMGDITLVLASNWQNDWFYKDGYFYYNKVMKPGDKTPYLLEQVTLTDSGLSTKYKDADIKIDVLANILQADGNAASTEWGITVSGNSVTN